MGTTSVIYRIILLSHIGAAIVGFGGLIAHGAYHAKAVRSQSDEAGALLKATTDIARWAEYGIYAVLALGIVLISLSDDVYSFAEPWVSASFVVWFLIVGLTHGATRPARAQLLALATTVPSNSGEALLNQPEAKPLLGRLALGEAATQLLLVVALVLMVWKPGH